MERSKGTGLFAAVSGREHKPKNKKPRDFHETPREAVIALLREEGNRISQEDLVWEPAAGGNALVNVLREWGLSVEATDIHPESGEMDKADFLLDFNVQNAPSRCIITNPPFSLCSKSKNHAWMWKTAVLNPSYVAYLLPQGWHCASGINSLWNKFRPARVYDMTWRLDFSGEGSPPSGFSWYVWDEKHSGGVELKRMAKPTKQEVEDFYYARGDFL